MLGFIARLFIALIMLAGIGGVGGYFLGESWFEAEGQQTSGDEDVIVELSSGMGLLSIAGRLEEESLIPNAKFFTLWVRFKGEGTRLRAGEYSIPPSSSMAEILQILTSGKVILHRVTVPEGRTSAQAVGILKADGVLLGEIEAVPPEGSLLPETYSFPRGATRVEILADMKAAHDELLDELWPKRASGLPFDTRLEAVVLASIVEKETALASERPRIAAVFVNRLKRGMRLQSDPTVIYGLTAGEPLGRGLRRSELDRETPYNTYVISGLPPTPIANPGRHSIAAVLNPPETKDLYFVADGSGGHVFSKTLNEHLNNVRKWRRIEREMNGK